VATETATLVFTDGDVTSPQSAALSGNGVAVIPPTPPTVPPPAGPSPKPDFSLAAPATVTVAQGASGSVIMTVTPSGGFKSAVALTCSDLPATVTCTPASVTPEDGKTPVTSTIKITTTAPSAAVALPSDRVQRLPMRQVIPILAALSLVSLIPSLKRMRLPLGIATTMLLLLTLAGCGSGGPSGGSVGPTTPTLVGGTPMGNYKLTVTGKSGSVTHSTIVTLTVN
jgi:hypothetical protein